MKKVLFLCTGNYYRSRLAEEYFNHLAELHSLEFKAISRGISQDLESNGNIGNLASEVVEILDGINVKCQTQGRKPQSVVRSELSESDFVFALDADEHEPMINSNFSEYSAKVRYLTVGDVHVEPIYVAVVKLVKQVEEVFKSLQG